MSGQFLIQEKDRPRAKHIRAQFELKRSLRKLDLIFNDQRTFGWLSVEELTDGVPSSAAHIAYDPFDQHFDYQATITKIAKRNIRIKTALLNQEIMSGVGNIYADEALWRAKVHPESLTSDLPKKKIAAVIDCATEVMREAIAKGGTSFDDLYINVNGESGFFEQSLSAYGREDQPCPRCGALIKRIVFGARSSHFCPRCQRTQRKKN
jgi:formamidopyrimidine-DNA glycosylase